MPHTPIDDARAAVLSRAARLESEELALEDALGRMLAGSLAAGTDLPPFDNSAMDGYALRAADTTAAQPSAPVRLELAGESRAGHPASAELRAGQAMRISTGAAMPNGADAVVRVEDAELVDGFVVVSNALDPGTDMRPAGDDVHAGDIVIAEGTRLGAGELAMAVGSGAARLPVTRRPRVNIVATGDELVPAGEPLGPGQIHESNSAMLIALASECGAQIGSVSRRVPDTAEATRQAITRGLDDCDVLIACGGVSVGVHDHVKPALADAGVEQVFWQVALRPGHPTWFGTLQRDGRPPLLVFGLPGNPVSAYVTFQLFAAPALRVLAGDAGRPLRLTARYSGPTLHKRAGFAQVLRCAVAAEDGQLVARLTATNQKSHVLASLVGGACLGFLDEALTTLADGDEIPVELPVSEYT